MTSRGTQTPELAAKATALEGPLAMLQVGTVFHGRYELVRCIRSGGMGAVYEVVDQKTRRRRALKVMLPSLVDNADFRARFQREATVTAEIESDHIVETFDADVDPSTGAPFLVMELLKGDDIGRVLEQRGALAPIEAVELLRQAALALDKTHAAGIVHRDLKPENLFLTRNDEGQPKVKVLDFGIAKVVESAGEARLTRAIGTPLYMAPEQIRGDGAIGPRADLFAFGHIAYALLSGEAYWNEDSIEAPAIYQLFSRMLLGPKEPPLLRASRRRGVSLPLGFDAWFYRAIAVDSAQRFDNAVTMIKELRRALSLGSDAFDDLSRLAEPTGRIESVPPGSRTPSGDAPLTRISGPQGTAVLPSGTGDAFAGGPGSPRAQTTARPLERNATMAPLESTPKRRTWPVAVAIFLTIAAVGLLALLLSVSSKTPPAVAAQAPSVDVAPVATTQTSTSTALQVVPAEAAPSAAPSSPASSASASVAAASKPLKLTATSQPTASVKATSSPAPAKPEDPTDRR